MSGRFKDLVLDAGDHQAQADWWCRVLGYRRLDEVRGTTRPAQWPVPIVDPAGKGPLIWVQPVPEPKPSTLRLHIDIYGDTAQLVEMGATVLRRKEESDDIEWDVLADPEGNEFCVFEPTQD